MGITTTIETCWFEAIILIIISVLLNKNWKIMLNILLDGVFGIQTCSLWCEWTNDVKYTIKKYYSSFISALNKKRVYDFLCGNI